MQRYISIDCATKSIAVSILEYNGKLIDLSDLTTILNLSVIKTITRNLAPDKANNKITEIERVNLIREFIDSEIIPLTTSNTIVLLEKQIATTPTYICYISLMTLLLSRDLTVKIIAPTYKNQLSIGDEKIGKYLQKYPDSYSANKQHSKALSRIIVPQLTNSQNVKFEKKMETDFADSLCQLIAYIVLKL